MSSVSLIFLTMNRSPKYEAITYTTSRVWSLYGDSCAFPYMLIHLHARIFFRKILIYMYTYTDTCLRVWNNNNLNHSPRFWSVVEQLCPDWKTRRLELRQLARQIPHF
ncbi:MAG: M48 family metallopeptidase [Azonexus sp.]